MRHRRHRIAAVIAAVAAVVALASQMAAAAESGVRVVLHARAGAEPVNARTLESTALLMRARARDMGLSDVSITTTTGARILVTYRGDPDAFTELTRTGDLRIYDFEGMTRFLTADPQQAARRAAALRGVPAGAPGRLYALPRVPGRGVVATAASDDPVSRRALARRVRGTPGGVVMVSMPSGYVLATETVVASRSRAPDLRQVVYIGLRDRPALTAGDVADAVAGSDSSGKGDPMVIVSLSRHGVAAFGTLTRGLAARGARRGTDQSMAFVEDGEILMTPTIDHRQYPTGIDASNGVQVLGPATDAEAVALARRVRTALPLYLDVLSVRRR